MKQTLGHRLLAFAAALSFAVLLSSPASAQGTAFTYQGSLDDAGAPASGLHDFRFRLYAVASGGSPIGSTFCVDNVSVIQGVFTAQLDFGQQYATTAQRYLEIEVRRDTGLSCANATGFVLMAPRQQLTATPMASHANSAFSLDAADGSPTNAVFVDNGGNVGVGTTSPAALFHLQGNPPVMLLQDTASASDQAGYVSFRNNALVETGWMGYGSTGSPQFSILNNRTGGDLRLYTGSGGHINLTSGPGGDINLVPGTGGDVGVGTFTPTAKLDVRGNIKLGSSGQYSALGGQEDLRLVRGTIDGNGTTLAGAGFSSQRTAEGAYEITFSPPFSGQPTVTANAQRPLGDEMRWAFVHSIDPTNVSVFTMFDFGDFTDSDFDFCAIGPR